MEVDLSRWFEYKPSLSAKITVKNYKGSRPIGDVVPANPFCARA